MALYMNWVPSILILSHFVTYLFAQGLQPYLLFADRDFGIIYRSNLNSSDIQRLVTGLHNPIALDYDYRQDSMFWSDVRARTISQAKLDGSEVTVLVSSGLSVVDGLSVDWVNGKLYWTDATLKHIEVYDMQTGIRRVLIRTGNTTSPRAIVVDPATRWMYWSDWGVVAKIERASMDGRSRQTLHGSQLVWPNGLTLDYQNQVLYWIDGSLDKIESSNVDGTNRRLIATFASSTPNYQGFSLSFFNNTLYWSDWGRDMIFSIFANGSSLTALIQGFTLPTGIEVVSENRQQLPQGTNPCASNNGGCSHLCLLSAAAADRYTCACPDNLGLDVHGRNCSGCSSTQFQCSNGQCISSSLQCNGISECSDGSDERNCFSCQSGAFRCSNGQCISSTDRCDGNRDCTDGSDETGCSSPTTGSSSSCSSTQFQCSNEQCISSSFRCDGIRTCSDGSDERNCFSCQSGAFRCSNGQCISSTDRCDGNQDCTDGSDESGCSSPTTGSSSSNVVGIAVGVTVGVIVLFVLLFIVICVVVTCYRARTSSRHLRKTATTTTQAATLTTPSQQGGSQTYPASGTNTSAHEMYAHRSPPEVACVSTPQYSPPPYQPLSTAQPATLTTTTQQGGSQTYPASRTEVKQASAHEMYAYRSPPEVRYASTPRYSPPPYQPPTTTPHAPISTTTVNKTSSQQGGGSKDAGKDVNLAPEHKMSTFSFTPEAALLFCN